MLRRLSRLPPAQLRVILALALLLIICLPAILAGVWFYNYTSRRVTEQVDYELQSMAVHNSRLIETWLAERRYDLGVVGRLRLINEWVAQARASRAGDTRTQDSLRLVLEGRRLLFGGRYSSFEIYDTSGVPLAPLIDTASIDASRFREAAHGRRVLSSRRLGRPDSAAMLELYAPVINADGDVQGVIIALTPMDPMYDLLTNRSPGFTEHAHIIDSLGRCLNVTRSEGTIGPGTRATEGQRRLAASNQPGAMFYTDERGEAVIGVARNVPLLGWWLLVERDQTDAFAQVTELRRVLWSVFGVIILLGGVLSVAIARVAVHRLERREHELRSTHEQLIAADRLASVGMMAASIAHEINNPLTTIKVLMHSMREQLAIDAAHRTDLEIILSEIDKIKSLILRFLQFARPRDPEFGVVNLSETLSRIASLVRPQAMSLKQTVIESYDDNAPSVWADSSQIGQVFLNILLNAMDATPPGGEIRITTESPDTETIVVTIGNSGTGLAPELEDRIFEPFFSTKTNGTGLGLSIARTIVDKHHGTIRARGLGAKGTEFEIRLSSHGQERSPWNGS